MKWRSSRHQADRDKRANLDAQAAAQSAYQNQQLQMQQAFQAQQNQYQQQRIAQQAQHNAMVKQQADYQMGEIKRLSEATEKRRQEVNERAQQTQIKLNAGTVRSNRRRIRGGIFGDSQQNQSQLNQRLG